ncbi:MAG: hypothetical protein KDA65_12585 [Planctomycetaceae bacterium]|nr:hypothetical protein [Planctomycetaceae bacterium]
MNGSPLIATTDGLYDLCQTGFEWTFIAGSTGAMLAIIVLLINLLCRRWISSFQMSLLWGLVLLRMLIPFAPGSEFSVQHILVSAYNWIDSTLYAPPDPGQPQLHRLNGPAVAAPALVNTDYVYGIDNEGRTIAQSVSQRSETISLEDLIPSLWSLISALIFIGSLVRYVLFHRRLTSKAPCTDPRLVQIYNHIAQRLSLHNLPPLVISSEVTQPAVMGLVRPKLILPPDITELKDDQIRMILLHELVHIKRFDIPLHWLLLVIKTMQWWNPFFWLAANRYRNLVEQTCDQAVIRILTINETNHQRCAHDYAELLLTMASRVQPSGWRISLPASLLGFLSGRLLKRSIANRMKAITQDRLRPSVWQIIIAILLLSSIGLTGFTDEPSPPIPPSKPAVFSGQLQSILVQPATNPVPQQRPKAPSTTETYDVTSILNHLTETNSLSMKEAILNFQTVATLSVSGEFVETRGEFEVKSSKDSVTNALLILETNNNEFQLSVHAPAVTQRNVARLLDIWTTSGIRQICIETRFISVNQDLVTFTDHQWDEIIGSPSRITEELSTEGQFPTNFEEEPATSFANVVTEEQLPVLKSTLTSEQSRRLIDQLQSHPRVNILFAPKITLFNGAQAEIRDIRTFAYVTGIDMDDSQNPMPQVQQLPDGISLKVSPRLNADLEQIVLQNRITIYNVDEIRTIMTRVANKPLSVQLPQFRKFQVNVSNDLADNETLLLGIPPTHDRKEFLYLMITPQLLTEETD